MAAVRSYRDDLQRPHCGSNRLPKDGRSRGKQTCRCRLCHYRFTPDGNRHYYTEQVKEQAIDMYGEGMAIAAISRVLEVKLGTVYGYSQHKLALGFAVQPSSASASEHSSRARLFVYPFVLRPSRFSRVRHSECNPSFQFTAPPLPTT